jgi:hypothetical protein
MKLFSPVWFHYGSHSPTRALHVEGTGHMWGGDEPCSTQRLIAPLSRACLHVLVCFSGRCCIAISSAFALSALWTNSRTCVGFTNWKTSITHTHTHALAHIVAASVPKVFAVAVVWALSTINWSNIAAGWLRPLGCGSYSGGRPGGLLFTLRFSMFSPVPPQ